MEKIKILMKNTYLTNIFIRIYYKNVKLIFFGILISSIRLLQLDIYFPYVVDDVLGPINFLNSNFKFRNSYILSNIYEENSILPYFKFVGFITKYVSYTLFYRVQYFLFSLIFIYGLYKLFKFFRINQIIILAIIVIVSILPFQSILLDYCFGFVPSAGKTLGPISQNLFPILIFHLINKEYKNSIFGIFILLFIHPASGLNLIPLFILYILYVNRVDAFKKIETRNYLISLFFLGTAFLSYILFTKGIVKPIVNYEDYKNIVKNIVPHPYPFYYKVKIISLVNLLFIILFYKQYLKNKITNTPNYCYFLSFLTVFLLYEFGMIVLNIFGDYFGIFSIIQFYPNRLLSILVLLLLIQLSIIINENNDQFRQMILLIFSLFFNAFVLWFYIIINKISIKKRNAHIINYLLLFILSAIRYSDKTFITLDFHSYLTYIPLCIYLFFDFIKFNYESYKYKLVYLTLLFCISITFILKRNMIEIVKNEKKLIKFIDKTNKNDAFLVLQSNNDLDNVLFFIENSSIRNMLPAKDALVLCVYNPQQVKKVYSDFNLFYNINLSSYFKGSMDTSFSTMFSNRILNFDKNQWKNIHNNFPYFKYVITSKNTIPLNNNYFDLAYKDNFYRIYEFKNTN